MIARGAIRNLTHGQVLLKTHIWKIHVDTDLLFCPYGSDLRAPLTREGAFFLPDQIFRKISLRAEPFHTAAYAKLLGRLRARFRWWVAARHYALVDALDPTVALAHRLLET